MIRRRKGLLCAALTVVTASVLSPVSGTGAHAASGSLRSGDHELVLTSGPTAQPVAVRDVAGGATVLVEQQPLQVIVKNGEVPSEANAQYASVVVESTRLVGTGDVRSRNGSVFRFRDSYEAAPGGGFSVSRTVTVVTANPADQGFNSRFTIGAAAPRPLQDYQFLAPGVMYDRNRNVPAGALGSNLNDNYLYFREMRMPLPFVMMHDPGSGLDVSLAHQNPRAASPVDEGSGAWLVNAGITHAALGAQRVPSSKLAIVYPGVEGEKNYVNRGAAWVRRSNPVTAGHSQSYQFRFRAHRTADFGAAVRDSWRYHWDMAKPEITKVPVERVYRSSVDVLASYQGTWGGAPGLPFSAWLPDGAVREVSYQMGFVGQQIPAAYLMLRDGYLNNRPDHVTKGRQILDFWAANSSAPSGLPRTWYDVNPPGWRSFYPTYLRIATDGMEGVLKASRFMRGRGAPVASWESYARRFGDWLVANQNADGSYYRSYNLAGTAPDNQAKYNTHNAIPFLMELAAYTGDTRYRTAALRAAEFAWQTVHLPSAYVGGTPDNPNVTDKEAASLALRAFLSAYDHTRDQRWLQAARRAADFAETWQFAWNYAVASSRPAYARYGVRGQSVIATGHSAMDTWQSGMLFDYYRLYRATNDDHYLQQARLLANNTKLTTQYPGNPLGYARDGLLEEAIGLADLRYGGVNLWLPWNSVAHAESLAMLQDTYGNMDIDVLSGGNPPAGPKQIRNRHSDLCLDDYNAVTTPGAEVRQWTCNDLPVQDWTPIPVGDGYYRIANGHSGLCLDNKDWATAPGSVVQQWTCNDLAVQHWRLSTTNGVTTLVNRHSGLCLDNYNFATAPGSEVRQWTCNGLAAQDWTVA